MGYFLPDISGGEDCCEPRVKGGRKKREKRRGRERRKRVRVWGVMVIRRKKKN